MFGVRAPRRTRPSIDPSFEQFLSNQQPYTIRRLQNLKPGQNFTWYRGHLTFDLDRSCGCDAYRDLLLRVRDMAHRLEAQGFVKLKQIARSGEKGELLYDYVATGI